MSEKWVTRSVYCNLCGHDWQAVYEYNETTRLECPNCHGMSRINEVSEV
jgi:Zn finger protein HypA/HybF involved in hydrogenase expression